MIAPWLLEILCRKRNWRLELRRIADELPKLSSERAMATIDVARAFEHLEPDRRFAISTYQRCGDDEEIGRALSLAIEAAWWAAVRPLAQRRRLATGSLDALVWEGRALIDLGEHGKAAQLVPEHPVDPRLQAVRVELDGGSEGALAHWQAQGRAQSGSAAAEAFMIAARIARATGMIDWVRWLEQAVAADPQHTGAVALWMEHYFQTPHDDCGALLGFLRRRLDVFDASGDLVAWCNATRELAMRLWSGVAGERHRGLVRRLLIAVLERVYRDALVEIPGHLAMWVVLDEAATVDSTRTEQLRLIVTALDLALPVADRVWLAALGADICAEQSNLAAARAYAAVAAEHAPLHPAVRDWFAGAAADPRCAEGEVEAFREALLLLDVEACQELQIESMAPIDEPSGIEIDVMSTGGGGAGSPLGGQAQDAIRHALLAIDYALIAPEPATVESAPSSSSSMPAWTPAGLAREAPGAARGRRNAQASEDGKRHRVTMLGLSSAVLRPPVAAAASSSPSATPVLSTSALIPELARRALAGAGRPLVLPPVAEPPQAVVRAPRIAVAIDLRMFIAGREIVMQSRDVSATGLFAVTDAVLPVGQLVQCELRIPGPGISEQSHSAVVRIARRGTIGYGLELVTPSPDLRTALSTLLPTAPR
jgi:hypothetical protein